MCEKVASPVSRAEKPLEKPAQEALPISINSEETDEALICNGQYQLICGFA